jgi:hypothetical protein
MTSSVAIVFATISTIETQLVDNFYYVPVQELRKQSSSISDLRTEMKTLQIDNIKLYEKVKYMQSYRTQTPAGVPHAQLARASDSHLFPTATKQPADQSFGTRGREEDIGKYKDKYEQSMNPFEAFRGRVSSAAIVVEGRLKISAIIAGGSTSRVCLESSR